MTTYTTWNGETGGYIVTPYATSIPATSVYAYFVGAGDCALWFDQTNGAAKLKTKAKQADGTVRTGEVALT